MPVLLDNLHKVLFLFFILSYCSIKILDKGDTPFGNVIETGQLLLINLNVILYDSLSGHSSTGMLRKLSSMAVVLKKLREIDNSCSVCGSVCSDLTKCNPRSSLIANTNCFFSSHDRCWENRDRVASSSVKYHEWRNIIFRPTFFSATSL